MRILQIIHRRQYRGAEIFCCQLANHLEQLGHHVEVLSIYEGVASLPFPRVKSLNRRERNWGLDISGWRDLSMFIKNFKPDIIQANAADTLKYTILSRLIFKWKIPIVFRNASTSSYYLNNFISKKFNLFLFKKVDFIISVSKASKDDLVKLYPFTLQKTIVIPIGIEKIHVPLKVFNPNIKRILHIGSFTNEKNHHGLISIYKKALKTKPGLELYLMGEGPLLKEIKEKVKLFNLSDKVFFLGNLEDPYPVIAASDVVVLPSFIEGLPGVLLEAMYCKIPVIAFDVGGTSEIVTQETGRLIEKDNEQAFVKAILDIFQDRDTEKLEKAYEMVVTEYLNTQITKKFVAAYEKIIGT